MKKPWQKERHHNSLPEVFSSINVPINAGFWKKLLAFTGPGLMVAVGYMDPGNWATDIAGGAKFGYTLLSVVLISNIFAMILQHLAVKLGVVAERDLAQACRDHFPPVVNFFLWLFCEIAIAAMDLAEVIGSAIALNLLFGIPLTWGIVITVADVLLILMLQAKGFRWIESIIAGLIFVILACFAYEIIISKPDIFPILKGLVPQKQVITNPSMLYIAIGILGATVMPHNLYLHSSIVQTRNYARTNEGKKEAIKFATIDSTFSLFLAFFINAAILIVAAATFHTTGNHDIADIHDAHKMLAPILGTSLASIVFAINLVINLLNQGFNFILRKPSITICPAFLVALWYGEKGTSELLVLSQVILSMQLSFAVIPLVMFTSDKLKMGEFVNKTALKIIAWIISFIIIVLNIYLLYQTFTGN